MVPQNYHILASLLWVISIHLVLQHQERNKNNMAIQLSKLFQKPGKVIAISGEYVCRAIAKKNLIPLLMLLLVIAITVVIFLNRDRVSELKNFGYLGVFLISLVSNASIVLPMPSLLLLFALGAALNPILIGLVGGTGGAIGELSGYIAGRSGRGITQNDKWFTRAERWMNRWGTLTVFVFALLPILPFDAAGVASGVVDFPIRKFLVACFLGKTLLYIAMALFGAWGWQALLRFMG